MKALILLADAAQAVDNKLYILGGGWTITNPTTAPSAIALKIQVPVEQTGQKHKWELVLLDSDNELVKVRDAERELRLGGEFEVSPGPIGRLDADLAVALNLGPLTLRPNQIYRWRLSIDDRTDEAWQVTFATRGEESHE